MATSERRIAAASTVAIVLAGGLGTRIRHLLGGLPKPLVEVAGRPFLEWVLRYLHAQGLRRVLISSGYGADQIERFASGFELPGLHVECIAEAEPLGTAGGFLNAWSKVNGPFAQALVVNGDSLMLAPLSRLFQTLGDRRIDGAMLGLEVDDAARYGSLDVDGEGFLQGFAEKRSGAATVNAGVYLLRRAAIERFPSLAGAQSLEFDVFPALLAGGTRLRVVELEAAFLDIGTEASLAQASRFVKDNHQWFA